MTHAAAAPAAAADGGGRRVGVFDSGVGGLTVLAALRRRLPAAQLLYVADSAFAPYGERDAAYVRARSMALSAFLLEQGAQAVVVACNTATALAIAELRRHWPQVPFIGIEPAVKPALAAAHGAPVGVLATPATLASAKFRKLLDTHGGGAPLLLQPCPGLAEAIETQGPDAPRTARLVERFCAPLREAGCATIVLGCTHYPLVATALRAALGNVELVDPADAVAAQTARILSTLPASAAPGPALQAWSNGDLGALQRVALACGLGALEARAIAAP
jgi:glutamate racemase